MDGERHRPFMPFPASAAATSVLGDDDLLREVLLRLDFPTCLVRAALVCRRWLRHASDPAFLRRFRALHPPRLLGLHVAEGTSPARFVPIPQPPEFAAAARRAGLVLGALGGSTVLFDCCNGRLLVKIYDRGSTAYAVRSLLHAARDTPILPTPPPSGPPEGPRFFRNQRMFLPEDDGDAMSCLCVNLACNGEKVSADFSILQSGVWGIQRSAITELQHSPIETMVGQKLIVGSKLYMMTSARYILGLDLAAASFFTVELPDRAGQSRVFKPRLSRAQHSGLYLLDAVGFQLRVWHGDGVGHWVLMDTICVREACGHIVQRWEAENGHTAPVSIVGVGDNAEFVFLQLGASGVICCMHLCSRAVEMVYQRTSGNHNYIMFIRPIMMVWPPIFPVLNN